MKKFMKSIQMMAALLLAVAATTACSNDDNAIDETTPATTGAPKTYTLTVTASKGGEATTRALSIDGTGALNATWTAGDAIRVMKRREMLGNVDFALLGTLTATTVSADGLTATFTGSLDEDKVTTAGGLAAGDKLLLGYPGTNLGSSTSALVFNYNGQDGTLQTLASNYDYCMTTTSKSKMVTVASVDGGVVTTKGTASFTNQQAIVRFNLYESDGETPFCPSSLDITAIGLVPSIALPESGDIASVPSEQTLTLTPDGSTNVIYAALRGISGQNVKLRAKNGDKVYTYTTKTTVTFSNGQYYDINVKMVDGYKTTNLASLSDDYTTSDYEVLTGTLKNNSHLTIPDGAYVKLNGVTISETDYAGIECLGDATIILIGENNVATSSGENAAIQAGPEGTTLTIIGDGSLYASNTNYSGAGIGSNWGSTCGDITISGGTITATGGTGGAGIGSGSGSAGCGLITISGGTVNATGGKNAAGIGCGWGSTCGNITITTDVTSVTAARGKDAICSIGWGYIGVGCGKVTIGGKVYYDGANFQNDGDTYLKNSPLVYEPGK